MKKIKLLTISLAIMFCLFCCFACNSNKGIEQALQGTWVAEWTAYGKKINRYYTFKGNTYTTGGTAILGELDVEKGTYVIESSVIRLIPNDGSDSNDLDYTYNETTSTITLWWNDDIQFQKGYLNVNY